MIIKLVWFNIECVEKRRVEKTYTDFFSFSPEHYTCCMCTVHCAFAADTEIPRYHNLSMHKLATIQFRSSEFNLMQHPRAYQWMHTHTQEFGINFMLRLNCRTLAIAGSCSMFIGMKTAIKSDHITINCIKINRFILFLFYFLNCSLTHSVTVSTTSTLNARTTTVLLSLFDFSLFFSLTVFSPFCSFVNCLFCCIGLSTSN